MQPFNAQSAAFRQSNAFPAQRAKETGRALGNGCACGSSGACLCHQTTVKPGAALHSRLIGPSQDKVTFGSQLGANSVNFANPSPHALRQGARFSLDGHSGDSIHFGANRKRKNQDVDDSTRGRNRRSERNEDTGRSRNNRTANSRRTRNDGDGDAQDSDNSTQQEVKVPKLLAWIPGAKLVAKVWNGVSGFFVEDDDEVDEVEAAKKAREAEREQAPLWKRPMFLGGVVGTLVGAGIGVAGFLITTGTLGLASFLSIPMMVAGGGIGLIGLICAGIAYRNSRQTQPTDEATQYVDSGGSFSQKLIPGLTQWAAQQMAFGQNVTDIKKLLSQSEALPKPFQQYFENVSNQYLQDVLPKRLAYVALQTLLDDRDTGTIIQKYDQGKEINENIQNMKDAKLFLEDFIDNWEATMDDEAQQDQPYLVFKDVFKRFEQALSGQLEALGEIDESDMELILDALKEVPDMAPPATPAPIWQAAQILAENKLTQNQLSRLRVAGYTNIQEIAQRIWDFYADEDTSDHLYKTMEKNKFELEKIQPAESNNTEKQKAMYEGFFRLLMDSISYPDTAIPNAEIESSAKHLAYGVLLAYQFMPKVSEKDLKIMFEL